MLKGNHLLPSAFENKGYRSPDDGVHLISGQSQGVTLTFQYCYLKVVTVLSLTLSENLMKPVGHPLWKYVCVCACVYACAFMCMCALCVHVWMCTHTHSKFSERNGASRCTLRTLILRNSDMETRPTSPNFLLPAHPPVQKLTVPEN